MANRPDASDFAKATPDKMADKSALVGQSWVHQVPFIPHLPLFIPRFPPVFPQVTPFRVHEIRLRMGPRRRHRNRHSREAKVERRGRRMSLGGCIALPPVSTLVLRLSVVAVSSPFSDRRPVEGAFLRILVSLPNFAKRRLEYQEYQDCQEYQEYQEDRDCPDYRAGAAGGTGHSCESWYPCRISPNGA